MSLVKTFNTVIIIFTSVINTWRTCLGCPGYVCNEWGRCAGPVFALEGAMANGQARGRGIVGVFQNGDPFLVSCLLGQGKLEVTVVSHSAGCCEVGGGDGWRSFDCQVRAKASVLNL